MRITATVNLIGALAVFCAAGFLAALLSPDAPAAEPVSAAPGPALTATPPLPTPPLNDDASRAELVASYQVLREQLRAAQATIVNDRLNAEERTRQQSAALNEKIEELKNALTVVSRRQHSEEQRGDFERARQQESTLRNNRLALIVAASVGGAVLLALFITAFIQWRAMNRIAEAVNLHPRLLAQSQANWPGAAPAVITEQAERAVATSNQRLLSAIERIEQRIEELEQTGVDPVPPRA